jgi:hypothetical protein
VIEEYPDICFSRCSMVLLKQIVFKVESYDGQIFPFAFITIGGKIIAAAVQ